MLQKTTFSKGNFSPFSSLCLISPALWTSSPEWRSKKRGGRERRERRGKKGKITSHRVLSREDSFGDCRGGDGVISESLVNVGEKRKKVARNQTRKGKESQQKENS